MKNAQELIKLNHMKVTKGRLAVLQYLIDTGEPLTIENISLGVGFLNKVTVYRILDIFVSRGLVYQTDFRKGKAYFEFQEHHHHHVVCTVCGYKEEIAACISPAILKSVIKETRSFSSIDRHMLEFFGVCNKCGVSKNNY